MCVCCTPELIYNLYLKSLHGCDERGAAHHCRGGGHAVAIPDNGKFTNS
jgi:hypothetical protein